MIATLRLEASGALFLAVALAVALPGANARAQDTARGEVLYKLCAQCHGENGAGDPQALAPSIAGLPAWFLTGQLQKFRAGGRGAHFDDISGMRMRPMSMWLHGDEDVANVAAYVASLPKMISAPTLTGGNAEAGKARYAVCQQCHGVNGEGNEGMKAPPVAGQSDWYQLSQLQKFKAGIRGGDPKDVQALLMRQMTMTLTDDQAMLDVLAYIATFTPQN